MKKTMRTNNLDELLKTLEKIRAEKYPHIPKELVESIVKEEFENQDSRTLANERVGKIIGLFLDKQGE